MPSEFAICSAPADGVHLAVMGWITVCVFAPAFLLGMGLCAMLCSFLLVKIIHLIGGDPDAADEESHDEER